MKLPYKACEWQGGKLKIIDQTKLPHKLCFEELSSLEQVWEAINKLKVRGAPLIGIVTAFGVVIGVGKEEQNFSFAKLEEIVRYLASARPTAVNLEWALSRMVNRAREAQGVSFSELKHILLDEALKIKAEEEIRSELMGKHAAQLIPNGGSILTYCNTGGLATSGLGTALAGIFTAHWLGKKFRVFVCETRPLLQGARLTTWELKEAGIDYRLICDNTAASVIKQEKVKCILVGADRITRKGDVANKIGTYGLAILANFHQIPFYVVAPSSTIDQRLKEPSQIPIETRDEKEVKQILKVKIAPENAPVLNPAFDITPAQLITAIVTEKGIVRPPYNF